MKFSTVDRLSGVRTTWEGDAPNIFLRCKEPRCWPMTSREVSEFQAMLATGQSLRDDLVGIKRYLIQ